MFVPREGKKLRTQLPFINTLSRVRGPSCQTGSERGTRLLVNQVAWERCPWVANISLPEHGLRPSTPAQYTSGGNHLLKWLNLRPAGDTAFRRVPASFISYWSTNQGHLTTVNLKIIRRFASHVGAVDQWSKHPHSIWKAWYKSDLQFSQYHIIQNNYTKYKYRNLYFYLYI